VTISDLNQLTREELTEKCLLLYDQYSQLQRMVFGQRRERFIASPLTLPNLFDQNNTFQASPEVQKEKISYERNKPQKSNHKGRQLLAQCTHLPVEREVLPMQQDVSGMTRIGECIQEKIAIKPAKLFLKHYVRFKYLDPTDGKIIIADPVAEPISKCEADISLINYILVSKFVYHLPEYRIIEILKNAGLKIPSSTMNGWTHGTITALIPLSKHLLNQLKSSGYTQIDETKLRVQDGERQNSTHLGYMWYYYSPEQKIVVINYEQNRGREGPTNILKEYAGYIQTDGYDVYKSIAKANPAIIHVGCMVHLRRYFEQALSDDKEKASYIIEQIQLLYNIEQSLRDDNASTAQRFTVRQTMALPILKNIHLKIQEYALKATPKSLFGKAITYSLNNWPAIEKYITNGRLEIDNNPVENKIRPIALGRKNFLFAGSHEAAERLAVIYSIMGTCKANDVNPSDYLNWLLPKVNDAKLTELDLYTPMAYKKLFPDS
jgi:transposase